MLMEKTKPFEELIVWQKAHQFVLAVYKFTEAFPKQEIYGLTSQSRRAAVHLSYIAHEELKVNLDEVAKLLSAYAKSILRNHKLQSPNS